MKIFQKFLQKFQGPLHQSILKKNLSLKTFCRDCFRNSTKYFSRKKKYYLWSSCLSGTPSNNLAEKVLMVRTNLEVPQKIFQKSNWKFIQGFLKIFFWNFSQEFLSDSCINSSNNVYRSFYENSFRKSTRNILKSSILQTFSHQLCHCFIHKMFKGSI